jgi:hypothetical protein
LELIEFVLGSDESFDLLREALILLSQGCHSQLGTFVLLARRFR